MKDNIQNDLTDMTRKLSEYVDKGRDMGFLGITSELPIAVNPDRRNIKPVKKVDNYEGQFVAVDCSTRTLKRANNWGIYLMRVAYASVKGHNVLWGYAESIASVVGDRRVRSNFLTDRRLQLESEMALKILHEESMPNIGRGSKALRKLNEGDYILLDGASFFGGKRGFYTLLYEEALRKKVNLLAISKQSPTLVDDKGRDFMAAACMLAPCPTWIYYPVREANKDKHLYGNVSVVKLCQDSSRAFRCDIMEYLANREVDDLVSPLLSLSEDPRCLGYPITLWLAHDFSTPSNPKLLHYHDQVEETLANGGLLDVLRMEELSANFADVLHRVKHPFQRELIQRV